MVKIGTFNIIRFSTFPLIASLMLALLVAFISARQFIGWPLDGTEVDFVMLPSILAKQEVFQNSLYLPLAEKVSQLSILPTIVSYLTDIGISPERQMVCFYLVQVFLMCLGIGSLLLVLASPKDRWLVFLGLLVFILSGRHSLYYFKLVSSTFVIGWVILIIALAIARKYYFAVFPLVLVGLIHPTFFLVTLGAIGFAHWFNREGKLRCAFTVGHWKTLFPIAAVAVIIFAHWLFKYQAVFQPGEDKALWLAYMQMRSDLAFPLRQGYYRLMPIFSFHFLAAWVFYREGKVTGEAKYLALCGMALFAVLLMLIQIFSSEVLRSSTLIRLALSHRVPPVFNPMIYAALIWVGLNRFVRGKAISWLMLVIIGGLYSVLPAVSAIGLDHMGAFALAILMLQFIEDSAVGKTRFGYTRVAGLMVCLTAAAALVIGGAVYNNFYNLIPVILAMVIEQWLLRNTNRYLWLAAKVQTLAVAAVILVLLSTQVKAIDWSSLRKDWHDFAVQNTDRPDNEHAQFIDFVTRKVAPDEQIFAVPFYLTQKYSSMPYRAMFMDWHESNYVLYLGAYVPKVIEKFQIYEIDPFTGFPWCHLQGMIWAKAGEDQYRCQRRWLQREANHKVMQWRGHVEKLRKIAPMVAWVLIEEKWLCPEEQVRASWNGFALVRLEDTVRNPFCLGKIDD
jgi:hypothetical protein